VITDYLMPGMDGMEMSRKINEINDKIPIILISGFGDVISERQAGESGIGKILLKPVLTRELALAVREMLENTM